MRVITAAFVRAYLSRLLYRAKDFESPQAKPSSPVRKVFEERLSAPRWRLWKLVEGEEKSLDHQGLWFPSLLLQLMSDGRKLWGCF